MGIVSHEDGAPVTGTGEPTSVYRYYDDHGVLLYVGITKRGMSRNYEHNGAAAWWPFVTRQKVFHLDSREEALKVERELIRRYHPPFNRQHNPGSADLRAAYLRFASSKPIEEKFNSAGHFIAPKKIRLLPLEPLHNGALIMRTVPEDASITRRFILGNLKPEPAVRDGSVGQIIGGVRQVHRHGDLLLVSMRGASLYDPPGALLTLKKHTVARTKDFEFTVKSVHLDAA